MLAHPLKTVGTGEDKRERARYMGKRLGIIGIIALLVVLGGCGTTATASSTPTPLPTATLAPTATPVPTVSSALVSACFGSTVSPSQVIQSGDILISPTSLNFLAYPSVTLPDGTPTNKPYKLTTAAKDVYTVDFPNSPATNPSLEEIHAGGYVVTICNTSTSQSHVLQAVSAKIVSSTPYNGQLSSWTLCDGLLDSHLRQAAGAGCGGGIAYCMCFHAVFPNGGAGTIVTMTQDASTIPSPPSDTIGKLPFTLKPGQPVRLSLGMDTPPTGTYTFAFGFTIDGAGPIYSANSPATLLAPVAHKWTGVGCLQPALEAQITPTNPETYYICAS
jgi:hypothetical protein